MRLSKNVIRKVFLRLLSSWKIVACTRRGNVDYKPYRRERNIFGDIRWPNKDVPVIVRNNHRRSG